MFSVGGSILPSVENFFRRQMVMGNILFKKKLPWILVTAICGVLAVALIVGTCIAFYYSTIINVYLGCQTSKIVETNPDEVQDTEYFKSAFESVDKLQEHEYALCEQIEGEGAVLLKNTGILPLGSGKNVSCFGRSSAPAYQYGGKTTAALVYAGSGSGSVDVSTAVDIGGGLKQAGFNVNEQLMNRYKTLLESEAKYQRTSAGMRDSVEVAKQKTQLGEVPYSEIESTVDSTFESYKDAAIVVLGRAGGEGTDVPQYEFNDGNKYYAIQDVEKELINKVTAKFDKVVVIIDSSNAVELEWLESNGKVGAILWIGGPGQTGCNAIGDILAGTINPSGRLVDTYAADSYSSAAFQNFGHRSFANKDTLKSKLGALGQEWYENGGNGYASSENYVVEREGIYVGYRYYETRYEDTVLGKGNASANVGVFAEGKTSWNYDDEVTYPFGYGKSYSTFKQTLDRVDVGNDKITVKVTVENTDGADGKDVVQVYFQSEYTPYDIANKVEKSAIELCGFAKTDVLKKGDKEQVTIEIDKRELAAYDSNKAKTYILENGKYYFAIGDSAHDALNNVLAKKGKSVGDDKKAYLWENNRFDDTTYATSNNHKITNRFDDADLNYYGVKLDYLSRNDWNATWAATYTDLDYTDKMVEALNYSNGDTYTAKKTDTSGITVGADTEYQVIMMQGRPYNDDQWKVLLDQLTIDDMARVVGKCGYSTPELESVGYPGSVAKDGPTGMSGTFTGGKNCMVYPTEVVTCSTWNVDLLEKMGECVGEDGLAVTTSDGKFARQVFWYAPAMNTHRTPYSGRNFEYYSEDGFIAGKMAAAEIRGASSKGLVCVIKHFAFNDQETNRLGINTFFNEQSAREIYLEPFRYAVEEGKATALMSSFNRVGCIWSGAHKGLMTEVLRNEWGFFGHTITDMNINRTWMNVKTGLLAGNDVWMSSTDTFHTILTRDLPNDAELLEAAREACHRMLYTAVNSAVMNGLSASSRVVSVTPWWQILLVTLDVILGVLAVAGSVMLVLTIIKKNKVA